jgi:DNA-binding NarL/FixJ family response regulator
MTAVVIADDQELVREGLRMMLDAEQDIEVVAEAGDGNEALAATRENDPDVVLMDVRMPNLDGIDATKRLVAAGARARVLMLTTFDLDEYVYRAMKAGASGFLLKKIAEQLVLEATTIKSHVARLLQKLGLRDRAQAIVFAYESGIVRPGS